jgi:hypothetical protein
MQSLGYGFLYLASQLYRIGEAWIDTLGRCQVGLTGLSRIRAYYRLLME